MDLTLEIILHKDMKTICTTCMHVPLHKLKLLNQKILHFMITFCNKYKNS